MAIPLVQALAEVALEDMSPGIKDLLPDLSPLYDKVYTQWQGVVRNHIGRNTSSVTADGTPGATQWIYKWIWRAAIGGYFKYTNPNPNLIDNPGSNVNVLNTNSGFPSPTDYVIARHANASVSLCEGRGTLALPWQLIRYNKLTTVLTDVMADEISASSELTALSCAVNYFSRQPNYAEVVRSTALKPGAAVHPCVVNRTLAQAEAGSGTTQTRITFYPSGSTPAIDGEDTCNRLRPGMSCSIFEVQYDDSAVTNKIVIRDMAPTSSTRGFIVDQVDPLQEAVSFVTKDGGNAQTPVTNAASDAVVYVVVLHGSGGFCTAGSSNAYALGGGYAAITGASTNTTALQDALTAAMTDSANTQKFGYGADGLESFIKTSLSDTLYGVGLSRLPLLKSMGITLTTADYLTELRLNDWIGWFMTQYGARKMFDTLITTYGVLNGYVRNLTTVSGSANDRLRMTIDKTDGAGRDFVAGWNNLKIVLRNRTFELIDDPFARRKMLFGIKTRDNNLKRLVPPPLKGAEGKPKFRDVEFIAPLGGSQGVFKWAHDGNGAMTDNLEAPYVMTYNNFVGDPVSLKVRNLLESTGATT